MSEIIKIQRPLFDSSGERQWLLYDKKKKHMRQIPEAAIPDSVINDMGTDLKGYFEANWSSIVGWAIGKRVKDQNW